jgi:hypothetical protein
MGKQFAQQVKESGKTKEEMTAKIMQRGCYGVADEWGRNIETIIKYAKDELEILDPPLFGVDGRKTNDIILRETILDMYAIWKEQDAQIEALKTEIRQRDAEERKRDEMARASLLEMREATRNFRNGLVATQ